MSGTQTGFNSVNTNALESMQAMLNNNKPTDGKSWQGASNTTPTPPSLEPYTLPSKKRNR